MMKWVIRMAYRELRRQRRRWLWTIAAIAIGTGALGGVAALARAIRFDLDHQVRSLLGADMLLSSRQPFADEVERMIDSLPADRSDEIVFASMVVAKKSGGNRLIQVRALEGNYPFYGKIETEPASASSDFRRDAFALVDDAVMVQYGLTTGDTIRLGLGYFEIAGRLKRMPGQAAAASLVSPQVLIPSAFLNATGLIRRGSRVTYRTYLRLKDVDAVEVETFKDRAQKLNISVETAEDRRQTFGRVFDNVTMFLQLMGLIAFILACVSIGSALHAYVREHWNEIAILRCLGVGWKPALGIFLVQLAWLSAAGIAVGMMMGAIIQLMLPSVVAIFLPIQVSSGIQWVPIAGIGVLTWTTTMIVGLIPLLPIRRISPLLSLRASVETPTRWDILQWAAFITVLTVLSMVLAHVMGSAGRAFAFSGGLMLVLFVLVLLSRLIMRLARGMSRFRIGMSWKYAVANLYRPGNQTRVMMLTIGVCVLMMGVIGLLDRGLVEQIALSDEGRQPNMVLFDIQTDQVDAIRRRLQDLGSPILQDVPIVTMRLKAIRGRSLEDIRRDSTSDVPRWAGEFRSTYRDTLIETETIVAGQLRRDPDSIWISMEENIAQQLDVTIGDRLDFDVQGVPMTTFIGSLRKVNWRRVQPNFYIVFPSAVLETAPQFHAIVTTAESAEASAGLQRSLVASFPNISIIDLRLILETVEKVLQQMKWVIQFMSLFTVAVAVFILGSAVWTSRFARIRDSVLLRTLGAQRSMIVRITAGEFVIMASVASLSGSIMAYAASIGILNWIFDTTSVSGWEWIGGTVLATIAIVVALGIGLNRNVLSRPPLDVIRAEC